ncbi:MAG: hypothetical protein HZB68_00805 [Candidatus Aenigmarchaeota archaeon]|nr:hypothetical protein [Candidatus Aenigmarchaeota archaeon]
MKGIMFAVTALLFAVMAVVALLLLSVLLPIGKPAAYSTVTINAENPSRAVIGIPAFLNVTIDSIKVPHSAGTHTENVFRNQRIEDAIMLHSVLGNADGIEGKVNSLFLQMFKDEPYQVSFLYRKINIVNGKPLPPPDNSKKESVTLDVAEPAGGMEEVNGIFDVERKPKQYKEFDDEKESHK